MEWYGMLHTSSVGAADVCGGVDLDLIEHDTTLNQGSTRVDNSQHKQAAYVLGFYHVEHIWHVVGI